MTKRQRAILAAVTAWNRRYDPKAPPFTTKQRDLLLKTGLLAPVVKPLTRRQRAQRQTTIDQKYGYRTGR